jgi:hypothetical protein
MSTATITQAQSKGLRHLFAQAVTAVRNFSVALSARDREIGARHAALVAPVESAREGQKSQMTLLSLAAESEAYSPRLAAELRYLAWLS